MDLIIIKNCRMADHPAKLYPGLIISLNDDLAQTLIDIKAAKRLYPEELEKKEKVKNNSIKKNK